MIHKEQWDFNVKVFCAGCREELPTWAEMRDDDRSEIIVMVKPCGQCMKWAHDEGYEKRRKEEP